MEIKEIKKINVQASNAVYLNMLASFGVYPNALAHVTKSTRPSLRLTRCQGSYVKIVRGEKGPGNKARTMHRVLLIFCCTYHNQYHNNFLCNKDSLCVLSSVHSSFNFRHIECVLIVLHTLTIFCCCQHRMVTVQCMQPALKATQR